jgi:hypothetical protein
MDTWGGRKRNPLSLNKYNYTEGNPVMNVDPSGNYLLELVTVTSMLMIMASCAEPSRGTASCGPCKGRKDSLGRDLFDSILEAAKDGERVTYSKFADDVKEFEYVTEIVIPIKEDTAKLFGKNACDAKCFAHEYPHTDENPVRIFNFDYGAAHKVVAYWHNHPDVWWYNGEKYNPLEISEPDKETARLIGGGTAYMTYKANEPPTNPENTVKERRLFWSVNDGDGTW